MEQPDEISRLSEVRQPRLGLGVGLGTFPFSNGFSHIDQPTAERIVGEFLNNGGRYIETAPVYPVNAVVLGDILRSHPRDSYFIATKCVTGFRDGVRTRSGDVAWLEHQLESELTRLGTDHLDLLQAHILPEDTSVEELVSTLDAFREGGKVRFIGLSNVDAPTLARALSIAHVDFVQNRFSFLHREEHQGLGDFSRSHRVILNPYQTIERGQLTSAPQPVRHSNDVRNTKHEYVGEPFNVVRAWVEELLLPIAADVGVPLEALAIAWTRQQAIHVLPVVGCTNVGQVRALVTGAQLDISLEVSSRLERAYAEMNNRTHAQFMLSIDEFRGLR